MKQLNSTGFKLDIPRIANVARTGMADIFRQVSAVVTDLQTEETLTEDPLLRELDHRARRVLALFARQTTIRSADVAGILGISQRQARELLTGWVKDGWLVVVDPSKRARKYGLSDDHRRLVE